MSDSSVMDAPVEDDNQEYFSPGYRKYALGLLTAVYTFNFVDRQVVGILQESIKRDLLLSDAQLGLLTGFAFAIFYVTAGIPLARWADKGTRKNLVALSLTVWSGMTAVCGLAQNYTQLLIARIGVGVGEAGGSPPSHSMISDYFPPEERATALAIYSMGINFGVLIGYMGGGYLNEIFDWRTAFILVGIPGILLAVLVKLTLREPPRGLSENRKVSGAPPSLKEVLSVLWTKPTFRYMAFAAALHAFVSYGVGNWMAPFLSRSHGLGTAEIGMWLGLLSGIAGGAGTFLGGYYADKLGKSDQRWYMWLPAAATIIMIPFALATYLLDDYVLALWVYIVPSFLGAMYLGPTLAVAHGMVGLQMRALSSAVLFFILNLIGLGGGPFLTGLLSDFLNPSLGDESLRWAMVSVAMVNVVCAGLYFMAAKTIRQDLANPPR